MTSIQQRAALQRQIWQIANDVRGSVDGWDFKQYVPGTLFYRFISENFATYIAADGPYIQYADMDDFDAHIIEDGFFGQEINHTTYNLARMNMSLHNINYDKFNIQPGNTLTYPHFFGTTIAGNILVLSKHKPDTRTRFIDGSGLFKKETNNNVLTDAHSESIMEVFDTRENVPHFAASVDHATVAGKDYNLSVSTYVEAKDTREVVDIGQLNAELASTVAKIDRLRTDIDAIVAEIEGEEVAV